MDKEIIERVNHIIDSRIADGHYADTWIVFKDIWHAALTNNYDFLANIDYLDYEQEDNSYDDYT